MRTMLRSKVTLLFMALGMLLAVPSVAYADLLADDINDVTVSAGSKTIVAGDSTTVGYRIQVQGGGGGVTPFDGQGGCNAADGSAANVTIITPPEVTATPGTLQFTSCTDAPTYPKSASFTAEKAGTYNISASISDTGTGLYTNRADWTLIVEKANTQVTDVSGTGTSGKSDGSLTAKLSSFKTDDTTFNKYLANKSVTFEIDGNPVPGSATTDANGVATLNNVNLSGVSAGDHTLKAIFAGDDGYLASEGTGTLTVAAPPCEWSRILPPVNQVSSHTATAISAYKQGSRGVVPVKFQLSCDGNLVDTAAEAAEIGDVTRSLKLVNPNDGSLGNDEPESVLTTPASSTNLFRFDDASDQYIYNLGVQGLNPGVYGLTVSGGGDTQLEYFKIFSK
jgi:hypothetical protein